MREIIFKGRREDTLEWVYGYVDATMYKDVVVIHSEASTHAVVPETVGQYTGLHDINGKAIYEGDIVTIFDPNDDYQGYGTVEYLEEYGVWYVDGEGRCSNDGLFEIYHEQECYYKVIGNIHDKEQKDEQ